MKRAIATLAFTMAGAASAADYTAVRQSIEVDAGADRVWTMFGNFCDISKVLGGVCTLTGGTGDLGTIRSLNDGQIQEPMIARTARSYTYGQLAGPMKDYDYHGTLAVEPLGAKRSRVFYTLVYDQEKLTPEQRAAQRTRLQGRFQGAIEKIKAAVEAK